MTRNRKTGQIHCLTSDSTYQWPPPHQSLVRLSFMLTVSMKCGLTVLERPLPPADNGYNLKESRVSVGPGYNVGRVK
jgi:hypothetical protein